MMTTTRPELIGDFGMVASTHWLATATAQSVLERGGTAIDAAVACAFVLHVVEPHLNGPGGDLTGLVAPAGEAPIVLAGQGAAPAGATIAHYTGLGLTEVPGAGPLAAAGFPSSRSRLYDTVRVVLCSVNYEWQTLHCVCERRGHEVRSHATARMAPRARRGSQSPSISICL